VDPDEGATLLQQIRRNFTAVLGEFLDHLFVQPNVHGCGIVGVAAIVQFLGQLFARIQATVDIDQLHQVDD